MENTENKSVISQESMDMISQTRNYLENTVFDVIITNPEERVGAITLGNEVQKRKSNLNKQRIKEKAPWNEKCDAVQEKFMPAIKAMKEKIDMLSAAAQKYDVELEQSRIAAQAKADSGADKVRDKLEAAAGTAKEKSLALLSEANRLREKSAKLQIEERAELDRQANRLYKRADEWRIKAGVKIEQAQAIVPEIVPETPQKTKGERKKKDVNITVEDIRAFINWCVETDCIEAYFILNEQALTDVHEATKGTLSMPGIKVSITQGLSFSGR